MHNFGASHWNQLHIFIVSPPPYVHFSHECMYACMRFTCMCTAVMYACMRVWGLHMHGFVVCYHTSLSSYCANTPATKGSDSLSDAARQKLSQCLPETHNINNKCVPHTLKYDKHHGIRVCACMCVCARMWGGWLGLQCCIIYIEWVHGFCAGSCVRVWVCVEGLSLLHTQTKFIAYIDRTSKIIRKCGENIFYKRVCIDMFIWVHPCTHNTCV